MNLSVDTRARKITLDGKSLETVTDLSLTWHRGEAPRVTIRADMDVTIDGEIFGEIYNEIYCPQCGFYIGKINEVGRIYGLKCPHCRSEVGKSAFNRGD